MANKYMLVLMILVLVVSGVLFYLSTLETPDNLNKNSQLITPTSVTPANGNRSIEQYLNNNNFNFVYFSDWKITKETSDSVVFEPKNKNKPETVFVSVSVSDLSKDKSLKTIAERLAQRPGAKCKTEEKINGISWCKFVEQFEGVSNTSYGFSKNSKDYVVQLNIGYGRQRMDYYLPDSEIKDELTFVDEIISTFSVTGQSE